MRSSLVPAVGSLLWFGIAPGFTTVLLPWAISGWKAQSPFLGMNATRWLGWLLILVGALELIEAFARFVFYGRGTPAPYLQTERLVITGSYRYVRNPMYVAAISIVLGEALILGNSVLLGYVLVLWIAFHVIVLFNEEPSLRRRYGRQYEDYCAAVGRWWPRTTPWAGSIR